jgi:hypothetical protein
LGTKSWVVWYLFRHQPLKLVSYYSGAASAGAFSRHAACISMQHASACIRMHQHATCTIFCHAACISMQHACSMHHHAACITTYARCSSFMKLLHDPWWPCPACIYR